MGEFFRDINILGQSAVNRGLSQSVVTARPLNVHTSGSQYVDNMFYPAAGSTSFKLFEDPRSEHISKLSGLYTLYDLKHTVKEFTKDFGYKSDIYDDAREMVLWQ